MKRPVIDIVVSPVASKFAKALQQGLNNAFNVQVFRRNSPKRLRNGSIRPHFRVTSNPLNKIEQFRRFEASGISSPRFSLSPDGARSLDVRTLFARTLTNSTNGRGIIEFNSDDATYPRAPLYTEYIPKKAEYRFHVYNRQVIDVQQKKKKRGFESERDTRIRNVHNGYIYARDGIAPPAGAANLAVRAVQALGYQYGAVDVIYNEKRDQSYVLEVNSRPGLMGTTLDNYVNAIGQQFSLERK